MATGTVADEREERKRGLERVKEELAAMVARYAAMEMAASEPGGTRASHPARLDVRLREAALSLLRQGLEAAYAGDRSDCGAANAPACAECGGRMRHVDRRVSTVETALGAVRMPTGQYACDGCGTTARPREAALDIEGSMTPGARRMASLAGSSLCCAEADRLLTELAGVNYGAKRVERTTRPVGDDLESRREAALSGSTTVLDRPSPDGVPERKALKEAEILCVALDGTGVPARPSETVGRAGKDGGRAGTREAKVGALWRMEPDGEGGTRPVEGSARYFAAVESAADDAGGDSPVARRLLRELADAGHW